MMRQARPNPDGSQPVTRPPGGGMYETTGPGARVTVDPPDAQPDAAPLERRRPGEFYPGPDGAAGVSLWGKIALSLESLTTEMRREYRNRAKLHESLRMVPVTGPELTTAGQVVDQPATLGPDLGYFWDIRRITFTPAPAWTTPWTGTIYLFSGVASASTLLDTWTPAGPMSHWYSKGYIVLHPHERLVYMASSDFTGAAAVGGGALQASDDCWPEYLS